jgi:hypothetical protein
MTFASIVKPAYYTLLNAAEFNFLRHYFINTFSRNGFFFPIRLTLAVYGFFVTSFTPLRDNQLTKSISFRGTLRSWTCATRISAKTATAQTRTRANLAVRVNPYPASGPLPLLHRRGRPR